MTVPRRFRSLPKKPPPAPPEPRLPLAVTAPARLRIRNAEPIDLPLLLALEELFPSDRMPARQFRRHIEQADGRLRVAYTNTGFAGYALVFMRRNHRVARLYSIAVHPDYRGRGIGARLLADAERVVQRAGRDCLRLEVRVDNQAAIGLYQAHGYCCFAHRPGYYEDGSDAFRYEKCLLAAR